MNGCILICFLFRELSNVIILYLLSLVEILLMGLIMCWIIGLLFRRYKMCSILISVIRYECLVWVCGFIVLMVVMMVFWVMLLILLILKIMVVCLFCLILEMNFLCCNRLLYFLMMGKVDMFCGRLCICNIIVLVVKLIWWGGLDVFLCCFINWIMIVIFIDLVMIIWWLMIVFIWCICFCGLMSVVCVI